MPRHGKKTVCCDRGATQWYPNACFQMADERLTEACKTGAQTMVTVCHYCNHLFSSRQAPGNLKVENYINLLAEAMGNHREDRFKKYKLWADSERILLDANDYIETSPFPYDLIEETVKNIFLNEPYL
jgi:hypothetical protein